MSSYKLPKEQVFRLLNNGEETSSDYYYDFLKKTAKYIRKMRKDKEMTSQELADKSGIATSVMSRIESGHQNISLLTLCKVLYSLDAELDFKTRGDK